MRATRLRLPAGPRLKTELHLRRRQARTISRSRRRTLGTLGCSFRLKAEATNHLGHSFRLKAEATTARSQSPARRMVRTPGCAAGTHPRTRVPALPQPGRARSAAGRSVGHLRHSRAPRDRDATRRRSPSRSHAAVPHPEGRIGTRPQDPARRRAIRRHQCRRVPIPASVTLRGMLASVTSFVS